MTAQADDRIAPAILLSILALLLFDGMGLIIKLLSDYYSAAELSAYRNFFGLIPSVIVLYSARSWHRAGRPWKIRQWQIACFRGILVTFAQLLFYYSLGRIAFATANTITYANALFMTALAVPLLGEKVGYLRWSAVLIGFAGVVMIVNPGSESFTIDALAPLGAAFLYALAGVLARRMDSDIPSPLVNLYSSTVALIGSLILAFVLGGFSPIRASSEIGWIIAMGFFGGLAVLSLVVSFRMTEQSNLAPFTYFGIPTSFVFGWLFFGETPVGDLFPGALLIVFGGLLVIWRERLLRAR